MWLPVASGEDQPEKSSKQYKTLVILLLFIVLTSFGFKLLAPTKVRPVQKVSYDHRSILIDNSRVLLLTGSFHYPRASVGEWYDILLKMKQGGLNTIDTYVFWNLHEPKKGEYNFQGNANLVKFLETAKQVGLYVNLRLGPYVCAEWNLGGLPYWLMDIPGMQLRTFNQPFMDEMERFIRLILDKVDHLLAINGGPIILLQMENEYGLVQKDIPRSTEYILWAAKLAKRLRVGVPWIMCQQDNVPIDLLTCNGFYCDNFINDHSKKYPLQPALYTELWTGWFSQWGVTLKTRPAQDLAFSVLRFIARGGTFISYYMYFGGTNFDRFAGAFITTSYDYDAPMTEYGQTTQKYLHLKSMHSILLEYQQDIVGDYQWSSLGGTTEAHVYNRIAFLSNFDDKYDHQVTFQGTILTLPKWSVSIVETKTRQILFVSSQIQLPIKTPIKRSLDLKITDISWAEQVPNYTVSSVNPTEQLSLTKDATDYLWYSTNIPSSSTIQFSQIEDVAHIWLNNTYIGTYHALDNLGSAQYSRISLKDTQVSFQQGGQLTVLTVVQGLYNYGAQMIVPKGLVGPVTVNGEPLVNWRHSIGIQQPTTWNVSRVPLYQTKTWYKIKFDLTLVNSSYAIDTSKIGKGMMWINGYSLGRFWNITSKGECKTCDYNGPYSPDNCSFNCNNPTQTLLKVPFDWLKSENELLYFDETGGDPTRIGIVSIS